VYCQSSIPSRGRGLFTLVLRASRETGGHFARKEAEVRRWSLPEV